MNPIKKEAIIGDCRLLLGDCLQILPVLGPFDALVTDPPYGIGERLSKGGRGGSFERLISADASEWDVKPAKEFLDLLLSITSEQLIWGGNFLPLPPTDKPLCWNKLRPNQKNLSEWEFAWTSLIGRAQMFNYCANGGFVNPEPNVHPTQKPVPLMDWSLSFFPKAKTVLDPYMGSGTTGVSCAKAGKAFTGIEREEKYFEIACKRIRKAYLQPDMFVEALKPPEQVGMDF